MTFLIKHFLLIFVAVTVLVGIAPGSAFSLIMTIDAIEDAGQFPGEKAYLKFVYPFGDHDVSASVPQWTESSHVYSYAMSHSIPKGWEIEAAGNIWSSDLFVGDSLPNLTAGVYRISVLGGGFMYDSFNWSGFAGKYWWELHIQALLPIVNGEIKNYFDYMLGSTSPYSSEDLALQASLGEYLDIPLAEGGSLIFWIPDTNSIDNSGRLSFNVVLIPEPSTFILTGTGLLLLLRRYRKYISAH